MNFFIKNKYREILLQINQNHVDGNKVSLLDFIAYTRVINGKRIWTEAFNKALSSADTVYIPKGKYYVDNAITILSGTKIKAHKKAEICLIKSATTVMFKNANVIDGSKRLIGENEPVSNDICISGGIWTTEYSSRAEYGKICAFDEKDSMHGVHALMLFSGVRNLRLSNMTFYHTPAFAIQLGRVNNFIVEKIKFIECYADGVHINGCVKNGIVYDISGEAGDDLVALNAYDWANSTINQGPIENIVINRINSKGRFFNLMRCLSGKSSEKEGSIDCYIKNILIDDVRGVDVYKMYFQTPEYIGTPEGSSVGHMENITIQNLKVLKTRPADGTPNYLDANPITGHYGVFEFGSNINGLTLKNIDVKLKGEEKYKDLEHLIVVGPKSYYIEEENLEVFDPYVVSKIENLSFKNIKVNGKKLDDIMKYTKEIKFDRIYDSEYASGYGKIVNTIKI